MRVNIKNILLATSLTFLLNACATVSGYDNPNYQKKVLLDNESCDMLATFDENDDLVYNGSYYGLLARTCKDYKQSIEIFDKVENSYKMDEDLEGNFSKISKAIGTFLVNDTITDYHSYDYERSMINIYKALNFMSLGDLNSANAELNRAAKRDERLEEKYKIIGEKAKNQTNAKLKNIKDNQDEITKKMSALYEKYGSYENNINPFGMYLRAIVYMIDNEPNKASDILKGLNAAYKGKNEIIKNDYLLAEQRANSINDSQKYIWLIYENGMSPTIGSGYFPYTYSDLATAGAIGVSVATKSYAPAVVATLNKTMILSVPIMQEGESSFDYLTMNGAKTQTISNMNTIMANELKKSLQASLSKAIYSNVVKDITSAGIGSVIGGAGGVFAMIGMDIYKQTTNTADTRMFIGLPNTFDAVRVENNGEAIIKDSYGKIIENITLNPNKHAIIYVKSKDEDNIIIYKFQS